MATADDLRQIALSLEVTVEAAHQDLITFKVAHIYAIMPSDGLSAKLLLSLDEQELHCRRAPAVYVPVSGGWGRMGYTTLTLSTMDVGELREVLTSAWRLAQIKRRSPR